MRREQTRIARYRSTTLPGGIAVALARTGRKDLQPEWIAWSLRTWRGICRQPRRELSKASDDRLFIGPEARNDLERAVHALSPRLARSLRQLIDPLDEAFLAKTLPDPFAYPWLPWWNRRLHEQSLPPRRHRRSGRNTSSSSISAPVSGSTVWHDHQA